MTASDMIRVGMPLDEFLRVGRKQSFELINNQRRFKTLSYGVLDGEDVLSEFKIELSKLFG